jgi:hypothetical protein
MAKKEVMSFDNHAGGITAATVVNVDGRVGPHGENRFADVLLVQSLFKYIQLGGMKIHLGSITIPKLDGAFGPKTAHAILHFQQIHARRVLRTDGIIHPASYAGRKIKDLGARVMTITQLHFCAMDAALMLNDNDYVAGLARIEPRLGPFLK